MLNSENQVEEVEILAQWSEEATGAFDEEGRIFDFRFSIFDSWKA
jgi:hypothetical protein